MSLAACILFCIAAVLFFLAAVGSPLIPTATAWGLVALSVGLALLAGRDWRVRG